MRIKALKRFLNGLTLVEEVKTQQCYVIKIETLKGLWAQIQARYNAAWQHWEALLGSGLIQNEYNNSEDSAQPYLIKFSVMAGKQHRITNTAQPLMANIVTHNWHFQKLQFRSCNRSFFHNRFKTDYEIRARNAKILGYGGL